MSEQKFPVLDDDFEIKIIGACKDAFERGLVKTLLTSGMHIKNCVELTEKNVKIQRGKAYFRWNRTKTSKGLQAPIRKDYLDDILAYITRPRKFSIRYHQLVLRDIGQRAGYDDISPMTFRHTLCVKLIQADWSVPEIAQRLGCSQDVVIQNYSILRSEELMKKEEGLGT